MLSKTERIVDEIVQILPDAGSILKAQLKKLEEEQLVSVLCTCVFYIADYNPKLLIWINQPGSLDEVLGWFLIAIFK